jgi:O-antigen/teichoic acid export membrane protein
VPLAAEAGTLTRRAAAGMVWTAVGRGATIVVQLAAMVALARLLTPADFGVVNAGLIVVGLAGIVSQLGLGPALVQRLEVERRHLGAALTGSLVCGAVLGGVLWISAPALAAFYHMPGSVPILRALAWLFPIRSAGTVADALVQRELRFRWLANMEAATLGAAYGLVGIPMAVAGTGPWALVGASLAQSVLRTGALLWVQPGSIVLRSDRRAFSDLLRFGTGFTLARLGNFLALQGDNLVVGRGLGPAALGLYGRAYQLMAAPASALGEVLDTVLFPAMARVQHDRERLASAYRRAAAFTALAVLPVSAGLVVLAPETVRLTLGAAWGGAVAPFQILAAGMLFRAGYKVSDAATRATGAVYQRAWRQGVYAVLVIGGATVGLAWGIAGVALGVVGALAINFLLMAQLALRLVGLGWGPLARAHLPGLALAAAIGALVWVVAAAGRAHGAGDALVLAATAASAGGLGVLVLRRRPPWLLGADGRWMLGLMDTLIAERRRVRPSVPMRPVGTAEGA